LVPTIAAHSTDNDDGLSAGAVAVVDSHLDVPRSSGVVNCMNYTLAEHGGAPYVLRLFNGSWMFYDDASKFCENIHNSS
jgi:hypothetical protein